MFPPDFRPELRWPLDIKQSEQGGRQIYVIADLLGVAPSPAAIPAPLMPIVSRFDGAHSIEEIAEEGRSVGLTREFVSELAEQLDRMFFLKTQVTVSKEREVKREYREGSIREAALAGLVYPSAADELMKAIDTSIALSAASPIAEDPLAVICPHIDYQRGSPTYGALYSAIQNMKRPDVVYLIGTSHQPGQGTFHLTDRSFETPFGIVPVAAAIVSDIARKFGEERAFRDEILHRREHSLELQLPYLARHFLQSGFPEIVPILVGSFHGHLVKGRSPMEDGEVADFIGALSESIKALRISGKRVLFYGGVDLAHVGTHFGDSKRFDAQDLERIARRDSELLNCILRGDEQALFEHMAEDCDVRRICGFPSIYVMLRAMKTAGYSMTGRLIEYRQAVDHNTDCHVTFASAVWFASN